MQQKLLHKNLTPKFECYTEATYSGLDNDLEMDSDVDTDDGTDLDTSVDYVELHGVAAAIGQVVWQAVGQAGSEVQMESQGGRVGVHPIQRRKGFEVK